MAKRKREEEEEYEEEEEDEDEERAVFVDTNLDTHFVVLVSPLHTFSLLKEQIVLEHSKCFPDYGEIKIAALKVKLEGLCYNVSGSMLLRTAFHGVDCWFVFADTVGHPINTSPNAQTILAQKLHLNMTNFDQTSILKLQKNPLKYLESSAVERELKISRSGVKSRRSRKKRRPNALGALAFSLPFEDIHKLESNNGLEESLLETKGLTSGFDGGANELKTLVSENDDLQKKEVVASNILPAKVVETSTGAELREKKRNDDCFTVGHVHSASSVSADGAAETDIAKGTPELPGQLKGTDKTSGRTLNQESVVRNAAVSRSLAKKTKKSQKGGGADLIINSVAALDYEKNISERESDKIGTAEGATPLKVTDDSGLLLSQRELLYLADKTGGKEEDATPLKSSELEKITESENTSKKRKTNKAKSSVTEKQYLSSIRENNDLESADARQKGTGTSSAGTPIHGVEISGAVSRSPRKPKKTNKKDVDGGNGTLAVPDIMQNGVAALDNEIFLPQRESEVDRAAEEGIMESVETVKKRNRRIANSSVTAKQDLSSRRHNKESAGSRQTVAEMLQPADISKPEQDAELKNRSRTRSQSKKTTQVENSSVIPLKEQLNENIRELADPETVNYDSLKDNGTNDAQLSREELNGTPARAVAANAAERTKGDKPQASKQTAKKSKKIERSSQVVTELKNDNLEAAVTGQIDAELLQSPKNSKLEKNAELRSVKSKNSSQTRQIVAEIDAPEFPMTEQVGKGKREMAFSKLADDLSTNTCMSGDKHQTELNMGRLEHLNAISVQKVARSNSKRKKLDHPSTVDTSSNLIKSKMDHEREGTSLLDHQLHRDVRKADQMRLIGVESFHPPLVDKAEVNQEIHTLKPRKKVQKKQSASEKNPLNLPTGKTVEQADDVMPRTNVSDAENQEDVLLQKNLHDGSAEVRKLDNEPASRLKAKKLDLSSSVDTVSNEHNLITTKKSEKSEINVQIGNELPNDVQKSLPLSQIGDNSLQPHQSNELVEPVDIQSVQVKSNMKKKPTLTASGLSEVEQPDIVPTHDNSYAAKQGKGLSLPEENYKDPYETPSQNVPFGLGETTRQGKPRASKQKLKSIDLPSSADITSKGENLTVSKKKSGTQNNAIDGSQLQKSVTDRKHDRKPHSNANQSTTLNSLAGALGQNNPARTSPNMDNGSEFVGTSTVSSGRLAKRRLGKNIDELQNKTDQEPVFKTPSNKNVGEPANGLPQKKRFLATSGVSLGDLSSDSSDAEVERNGSSSSTRTPSEEFSSSDYSEGESKGDMATSQHAPKDGARDKTNLNLSQDLPDLSLDTILRSSRRYKKAKLVASQSQLEDDESPLPEFVPDSLP